MEDNKKTKLAKRLFHIFLSDSGNLIQENLFLSMKTNSFTIDDFMNYIEKEEIIYHMAPLIADFLKRFVSLERINDIFIKYDSRKIKKKPKFNKLSPRNLIEFFLQINIPQNRSLAGIYLAQKKSWIPLSYWKYNYKKEVFSYKVDMSVLYNITHLFNDKKLILNFSFDKEKIGKTALLLDLFDIEEEALNINEGILREGTVDLYITNKYAIIDINGFPEDDIFEDFLMDINEFCSGAMLHINSQEPNEIKKTLKKIDTYGLEDIKNYFLFFRNQEKSPSSNLKNYIGELEEKFPDIMLLQNLDELKKNERKNQMLKLKPKFEIWLENLKKKKKTLNLKEILRLEKIYENSKEYFKTIDKTIKECESDKKKIVPFQKYLPFAFNQYQLFKNPENNDPILKIEIKISDLLSFKFANYAISDKFLELKYFDDKIKKSITVNLENLKNEINQLNTDYQKKPSDDIKLKLNDKIESITNNSVNTHDLFAELYSYYEYKKNEKFSHFSNEEKKFFESLRAYTVKSLLNGNKIHIFRGVPLKIKNEFLKEIFELPEMNDNVSFYVISILGMQSSGKSTLLNYLFGSDFETSAGRCTRGIYLNIIGTKNPKIKVLLLDTEGLDSIDTSDKMFDHKIALMCFGLSDLVLINQKGEISSQIQDLFSISLYAMNYFQQLRGCFPKIFFILRDQVDRDIKFQDSAFKKLENQLLEIAASKKIEQVFKMQKDCLFLLPSAFNEDKRSAIFGEEILKLRNKIFDYISSNTTKKKIIDIYINACSLWEIFDKFGQRLLCCETLKEYETKLTLEAKIKLIAKNACDIILQNVNQEMEDLKTNMSKSANLKEFETFNFKELIEKKFVNNMKKLETSEFGVLRKEFEAYPKLVDNAIQDLKDYYKCEEGNSIYSWNFKFHSLLKDLKLKEFEKSFSEKLNEKMKNLIQKSIMNPEKDFDEFINVNLNAFIKALDSDYNSQNNINDEFFKIIIAFNRFKRNNIDDLSKDIVEKFKKTNYLTENWYNSKGKDNKDQIINTLKMIIDGYYKELKANKEITELNEKITLNFFDFLENIRNNVQLKNINYDLITHEQCCQFVLVINEVIFNNKRRKYEEIKEIYREKAEKKREEFLGIFKNRKNDLTLIENLSINFLNQIIEIEIENFNNSNFQKIENKLKTIPIDPEKFIEFAYNKSFSAFNPEKIYRYVVNVNKFVEKIFDEHTQEILHDVLNEVEGKMENVINKTIKEFEDYIKNYLKNQKKKKEIVSQEFFDQLKTKYPDIDLKYDRLFARNISKKVFKEFVKNINFRDKIQNIPDQKKNLEKRAKEFILGKKTIIKGCQRLCPFCRSKCIKPSGGHKAHQAYHILNCFGGTHYHITREVSKEHCMSKKNIESQWLSGDSEVVYSNLLDLCEKKYPQWLDDFRNHEKMLLEEAEIEKQLKCWNYVRLPLLKKYNVKDSKADQLILDAKALKENFVRIL